MIRLDSTTLSTIINTGISKHAKLSECFLISDSSVTNDLSPGNELFQVSRIDEQNYTVTDVTTSNIVVIRPESYNGEFWFNNF